jgi:trk system potassium uptake protein TrkH
MNTALIAKVLGWLLAMLGGLLLVPCAVAWLYDEPSLHFLAASAVGILFGGLLGGTIRPARSQMRAREGFLVVVLGWLAASALGAIPYFISYALPLPDAIFESVSGFTTTGATVMTDLDGQPRSLLLWRAMTQWLGGMGIIVFAIAVLPLLGIGGMQLFRAETPGVVTEKIAPRMAATARRLWMIYLGFSALEFVLLAAAGMPAFEALCHAFTTAATGGFSTRDDSIRAFGSARIDWIVIVFMVIGGINYVLHFEMLTGRFRQALRDAELRYYLGTLVGITLVVAFLLRLEPTEDHGGLRGAAFQVTSMMTGTGYHTALFDQWPVDSQIVLLLLMLLGGMAGSTTGAVKGLRVLISIRVLSDALTQLVHPRAIQRVKHEDQPIPAEILTGVWAFLIAYGLLVAGTSVVVAAEGLDLVTAISVAVSAVGNVGPALGEAGPIDGYAHFDTDTKLVLASVMIMGRLEILPVLVIFHPRFRRQ